MNERKIYLFFLQINYGLCLIKYIVADIDFHPFCHVGSLLEQVLEQVHCHVNKCCNKLHVDMNKVFNEFIVTLSRGRDLRQVLHYWSIPDTLAGILFAEQESFPQLVSARVHAYVSVCVCAC